MSTALATKSHENNAEEITNEPQNDISSKILNQLTDLSQWLGVLDLKLTKKDDKQTLQAADDNVNDEKSQNSATVPTHSDIHKHDR